MSRYMEVVEPHQELSKLMQGVQSLELQAKELDELARDILATIEVNWQREHLKACDEKAAKMFAELVQRWRQQHKEIMERQSC